MKRVQAFVVGFGLLVAAQSVARADEATSEVQLGPKVGAKAPTFELKDQAGKEQSLDDLLKRGKVALVFYRSANW